MTGADTRPPPRFFTRFLSWAPRGHWQWALIWVAAVALLVDAAWLSWGHLVIDTGTETYTPWALTKGDVLYRDLHYAFGPFTPYFHAFLFTLFKPHLLVLYASGLLTCLLTGWLVQRLAARHLPPWQGAFVALLFVMANAFGFYNYGNIFNYMAPYSYTTIHSMLFALGALWFHGRHLETRRLRHRACALGLLFLALLTRVEIGGYLAIAMGFGSLLDESPGGVTPRRLLREVGLLSLPVLAAAAVYFGFLSAAGDSGFWRAYGAYVSGYDFSERPRGIYAWALGIIQPAKNVREILLSAAATAGAGLLFGAAAASLGRIVSRRLPVRGMLAWGGIAAVCGWLGFQSHQVVSYRLAIKYLPLLAVVLVFFYAWQARRLEGTRRRDAVMLATLALFSLLAIARILLRTNFGFYGFYLTVPGLILSQVFLLREIPALLPWASLKPFARLGFVLHGLLMAATLQVNAQDAVGRRTLEVRSPRGTMRVGNTPRMQCLAYVVDLLGRRPGPKADLVVFPEGVGLNFFLGMKNPLYLNIYLPMDLAPPGAVDRVIREMEATKPEYVVEVERNVRAYGKKGFDIGYGKPIMDYLERNYSLVYYVPAACMLLRRTDRI